MGKIFENLVFQTVLLAEMVGFEEFQPSHINVQIHLFFDMWISSTQCLNFCITQCRFINIFSRTYRGLACHDLTNEFLFALYQLKEVGVEGIFCDISVDFHLFVFISLTNNATFSLLQVSRPPWAIQMVQGNQFALYISSSSHFCGTSKKNTHGSAAYFGEQLLFLLFCVGIVDIGNFFSRNALCNELVSQVIIHIEGAIAFGG